VIYKAEVHLLVNVRLWWTQQIFINSGMTSLHYRWPKSILHCQVTWNITYI